MATQAGGGVARGGVAPAPWAVAFVGRPYPSHPFGCWQFAREVLVALGRAVPSGVPAGAPVENGVQVRQHLWLVLEGWRHVVQGAERPGDVVLFRAHRYGVHIGVVVAHGLMLHVEPGQTAVLARMDDVEWRDRGIGCWRAPQRI